MDDTPPLVDDLAGLDSRMKKDLLDRYGKLLKILDAALDAKRKIKRPDGTECDKCGCKHVWYEEVEDVKTARETAEWFSNRAFGRPSAAETEQDSEKIIFTRKVVYSGAPEDA